MLWKEREDALGVTEDARREVEEDRLATVMAKNVLDAAQVEAAYLREELKGADHSLPFFLSAGPGL